MERKYVTLYEIYPKNSDNKQYITKLNSLTGILIRKKILITIATNVIDSIINNVKKLCSIKFYKTAFRSINLFLYY